jgi:ribosomal protein L44E
MSSLKDALMKAGLSSSKVENVRKSKYKSDKTKVEKHQEKRNFCEVCETTQPDVEHFKHRNSRIDAQWICVNCADKNEIHDKFRTTAQSDFNLQGRYQRFYGPTLQVSGKEWNAKSGKGPRPKKDDSKPKKQEPRYIIDEDGEKNFNC